MMKNYIFTKRFIKQFAFAFLLMITMAIKAQNPVNISVATIDQATANTIQGHLNNGTDVIVTSSGAITVLNGVTILKSLGGDASLTLKANFRVTMDVNTSIKSTVGKLHLIFWSNAVNNVNTKGMTRFGDQTTPSANVVIESNGGHLWIGGGDTSTTWNGLSVGNGYSWGGATPGNGWFGIELNGDCRFYTSGGNVALFGKSSDQTAGQGGTVGIAMARSIINAGSGDIFINTLTDGNAPSSVGTTGLYVSGDGGFTTTTGNITINNTLAVQGNTSGTATGILLVRNTTGNPIITSNQGNVSIVNDFSNTVASTKWYIDVNETSISKEKSLTESSFTDVVPSVLTNATSTFTSSNNPVATVDNNGLVTPLTLGNTEITGIFSRNDWNPIDSRWRYNIDIVNKIDPNLSFPQSEVYKNVNDPSFTTASTQLNVSGVVGVISYTSSNRSVATVDSVTGEVTLVGEGSTIIEATSTSTLTYLEGKTDYKLFVVDGLVVFTSSAAPNNSFVTVSGNAISDGGNTVTERGFVYATTTQPSISNNKVVLGSGLGVFSGSTPSLEDGTYYFRAYATNSTNTEYGSEFAINIDATLSISNPEITNISVYPNPVKNSITIKNNATIDSVEIYNTFGSVLITKSVSSSLINMNLSNLASGVYFIRIQSEGNFYTERIIKD
tara:strand:- start:353721 stop:355730 length:2010 start_codon:yes stop_codon:yes gene_type:complete